jgi:hypothetical protein
MNRDELLTALQASAAQKPRAVFIKGWGEVFIRALTVAEVEEQTDDTAKKDAEGNVVLDKNRLARSAARLLCDAQGTKLLDPDNADDVALLAQQPWKLLRLVLNESDDLKDAEKGN